MIQSSLATKSQSFDLVKSEIEQTIRNAETSLERFQETRESGEDLQNCTSSGAFLCWWSSGAAHSCAKRQ